MGTPALVALMVSSMLIAVAVAALIAERRYRARTNRA